MAMDHSNLSSATVISHIETESSTRAGAQTRMGFSWSTRSFKGRSSEQSWPNGKLPNGRPPPTSQNTIAVTARNVPAKPRSSRKNIRQAVSKFTSAFTTKFPSPDVTANDLSTEAEMENMLPTEAQLSNAASLNVVSESGIRILFGDLWLGQKTIVCFIRHFWCVDSSGHVGPQFIVFWYQGAHRAKITCPRFRT
jgi:hypothetical protein